MPFKSKKQKAWMHANKPKMAKRWEKEYQKGGRLKGASHDKGGIDINVEGGEYIIKKDSVNRGTLDTLKYINQHGDIPLSDARKRGKK